MPIISSLQMSAARFNRFVRQLWDTRSAVRWLKRQGYEKIGIVAPASVRALAFLRLPHDLDIDTAVFNHVSAIPPTSSGTASRPITSKRLSATTSPVDELREYWLPISPMAYMDRLAKLPPRPQRYIYTLYDLSFPVDLSRATDPMP